MLSVFIIHLWSSNQNLQVNSQILESIYFMLKRISIKHLLMWDTEELLEATEYFVDNFFVISLKLQTKEMFFSFTFNTW